MQSIHRRTPVILCACMGVVTFAPMTPAANTVWDGTVGPNWSSTSGSDSNWTGGGGTNGRPAANDSLQFAGSTNVSTNNDYAADTKFNGITFNVGASSFTLGGSRIILNGNIVNSSGVAQTIDLDMVLSANRTINPNAASITVNGDIIDDATGGRALTKSNGGTLVLGGSNAYTGGTNITGGTVQLAGADDRLPTGGAVTLQNGNSASAAGGLDLHGFNQTISALGSSTAGSGAFLGSVTNSASSTTSTLSVAGSSTFGGTLKDGAGRLALTKSTGGTLVLTGTHTYSGATSITGGTLQVDGVLTASAVAVNTGSLAGGGSITGSVTVGDATGSADAFLSPGTGIGTIGTGDLTFASDGVYQPQISGTSADSTSVSGNVTLAGNTLATATPLDATILTTAPTIGQLYFIVNNLGSNGVSGLFKSGSTLLTQGSTFDLTLNDSTYRFSVSYTGDFAADTFTGGNDIVLQNVAVPEPAFLALPACCVVAAAARRRRR